MFPTKILDHLGVLRNPILIFAILSTLIINISAWPLANAEGQGVLLKNIAGFTMLLLSIVMMVGAGVFYGYAVIHLPHTWQELEFKQSVLRTSREHDARLEGHFSQP